MTQQGPYVLMQLLHPMLISSIIASMRVAAASSVKLRPRPLHQVLLGPALQPTMGAEVFY
jgi:hypothetical protein